MTRNSGLGDYVLRGMGAQTAVRKDAVGARLAGEAS